jgi:hypothetical protein
MEKSTKQRVEAIFEAAVGRDLSSKERHDFLPSIAQRVSPLTPKQETWLLSIEARLGLVHTGEDDDPESDEEDEDDTLLQSTDSFNGHPF